MRFRIVFVFLFALGLSALVHAQSAHWDPPSGALPLGQNTGLRLVFDECAPKTEITPPKVDGLTLQFYGRASNTSILNGSVSVTEVLTFAATLTKNQRVEIPSFIVETNKGNVRVPAARFEPTAATVGRSGTPLTDAASAKLAAAPATVWAGEVFEVVATVEAARSYYPQFTRGFDWTPDPLLVESWSDPQQTDFGSAAEPHTGFTYRTRALARSPGRFNLNAATHIVNLSVGISGFGFFQQRQYDQYSIVSNTPTLEIKALPAPPAGFSGGVGQFKIVSKIVPEKAAVGEPVTWTVELSGTGNWPDIAGLPSRDVSNDFKVVQPKARRTPAEGKAFDVTLSEDVVLVPTKAGSYALGPLAFTYFDPKTGGYKTVSCPRTTVTITGPVAPPATATSPAGAEPNPAGKETERPESAAKSPPAVPPPPAGIPRDPLTGSEPVSTPLTARTLTLLILAPFSAVLALWIGLALREARLTDPLRPRREAHERLGLTLQKLRTAHDAERNALLLAWQSDTAKLWRLPQAAPAATAMPDAAWSTLWAEADRALYGTHSALPADWVARAEAALAAKKISGFKPLRLFLPRNLFPFAALVALAFLAPRALLLAAESDATSAYHRGDFAAAEKSWRSALAKNPTDWIARHNLSLALAQQERAGEAAGHAIAAFVQNPSAPAARWHFALAAGKAGFVPPALAPFLDPGPLPSLARLASPAVWQRALVAAAFLAAIAAGWLLLHAYGHKARRPRLVPPVLITLALLLAGTSIAGVLGYGLAADENAVVVARAGTLRSIPTEADTAQKTTPLSAGSLALIDKTFLGWVRLAFENGQTGWVRKEEVVGLWK